MSDEQISGKITFIHHDKNRAVIEYEEKGKKKTVHADISETAQERLIEKKLQKKKRRFLIGDQVKFIIKKTGANGKILYATDLQYQYNTTLELLLNKALKENKFLGYIKITDYKYFIKEIDSYLFFPLALSAYEIPPTVGETGQPVTFKLDNIDKPDKVTASLYNHTYIPEFNIAVQHFKKQTPVDAVVYNISPFAVYVNLVGDKIQSKLSIDEELQKKIDNKSIQLNTVIPVKIKHISNDRIVIEAAE